MSTGIEWTDETWNPTTGCTKVSPGCDHCYAERITNRFNGPGAFDRMVLHPARLDKPLRWRKPRRVFVNSMSDLFHDSVPDEFIARVFATMAFSFRHTFQILTKRAGRMRSLVPRLPAIIDEMRARGDEWFPDAAMDTINGIAWPLPNVWLGVSVEDQKRADLRIPALLETPAAVRFLSCEPLLGPIGLGGWVTDECTEPSHFYGCSPGDPGCSGLGWVIVGGESGPNARPMHPDWARSLRDQCQAAGVPFFFKQWGEWAPVVAAGITINGRDVEVAGDPVYVDELPGRAPIVEWVGEFPDAVKMALVGKKRAGRMLDDRLWEEHPERQAVLA